MTNQRFVDGPPHPDPETLSSRPERTARSGETRFSATMPAHLTQTSATRRTLLALALPLLLLAAALILLRFPPTQYGFYPECPIHRFLGILCPGCGTTRALSALLHGHVNEALRLNALTMLLLPMALFYAVAAYLPLITHRPAVLPRLPNAAAYAILVAAIVFTVVRNL